MNPELTRVVIVLALAAMIGAAVELARWRIERRRRRVLTSTPALELPEAGQRDAAPVRILVFSSDDCAQCHRLQAPAIQRVLAARGSSIAVTEVDAPTSPELTERYQILTLPSTVVLDTAGKAQTINYGFADSTKLLRQVDSLLTSDASQVAV